MTKHRDWTISEDDYWSIFEAVHDNYSAEHDGTGTWVGSHPIIHGRTEKECIEYIDDWYEENEDDL